MYECYPFAAEKYVLNKLKEAGIDPFSTKIYFGLKKLRKEIEMDFRRKTLKEYIKHLRKARAETEVKQDLVADSTPKLDERATTLGIIIRDLEKIDTQEFSYWDV
jgi:hypothetical protein